MKLTDLKPAAYNPRKITDAQLARLKKSLEEFGDPFNSELAKTRRELGRDQYGALYMPVLDTAMPYQDEYDKISVSAHRFRCDWLQSRAAEPAGLSAAWECVRAIEKGADEHGGWEQRSSWDEKGRGWCLDLHPRVPERLGRRSVIIP